MRSSFETQVNTINTSLKTAKERGREKEWFGAAGPAKKSANMRLNRLNVGKV